MGMPYSYTYIPPNFCNICVSKTQLHAIHISISLFQGRRHSPTGIGNVVKKEISSDTVSSESYYKPVLTEHTHNRPSTGVDLRAAVFANPRLLVPDLSSRRPEQIGSSACPPPLLRSPTDGTTITERTRDMKALNGDSKPRLPPPPLIKSPTRTDSSVSALMKAPAINSQGTYSIIMRDI